MINLYNYAKLLIEQKLSENQIGNIVYSVYRIKFDLDMKQIELKTSKRAHSPNTQWQFFRDDHASIDLFFNYKNIFVQVINDLTRYKFSTDEVESILNTEDESLFADLMSKGDSMTHYGFTKDNLLKGDIQNKFATTLLIWKNNPFEYKQKYKRILPPDIYTHVGNFPGVKNNSKNITNLENLIDAVKKRIDNYLDDGINNGNDDDDSPDPKPTNPKAGNFVTT